MASSLTHQPPSHNSQRPFLSAPFFPLDLNQSALYNLYYGANMGGINQLVQSAQLFGIKELNESEPPAFSLPSAAADSKHESAPPAKTTPPAVAHEFAADFALPPAQSNGHSSAQLHEFAGHALGSSACDSDGSVSSYDPLNPSAVGAHAADKKRKELVRDDAYWERRRKNNDAAKRSRDSRRRKEDEVAVRAALLEQENLRLRFEVERLRTEIERHRIVALNSKLVARHPFVGAALQATP
ncbi:Protein giant [Aphelenchoides fujianensis]|nr:Protein giant [Aphelenchoides fujianensis]